MYSVLLLIVSFGALSGLYVLLGAPFVAAIQIIIYAGAIMVLFLFVVMLLNVPTEDPPTGRHARLLGGAGPRRFGAVLSLCLVVELAWALRRLQARRLPATAAAPTTVGARDRPAAVPRLRVRVRSDVGADSRRHGRRDHPGAEGDRRVSVMLPEPTLNSYLHAVGRAVLHRHGGRVPAAQPDHDPAVGRGDAERGQPDVRRGRPLPRHASTGRSSCSSS